MGGGDSKLEPILERVDEAARQNRRVTLGAVTRAVGTRSFGPLLLVAGLIALSPLAAIPGMPTSTGLLVLAISAQLLLRRRQLWLPKWLLRRSLARGKVRKALGWLRKPAHLADGKVRPRLVILAQPPADYAIALACVVIGLMMPLTEVVPLAVHGAGAAIAAFGLALTARDGLVVLAAFVIAGLVMLPLAVNLM